MQSGNNVAQRRLNVIQRWYNIIATLFQRSLNYIEANLSSNKYVFVEFVDRLISSILINEKIFIKQFK